MGVGTSQKIKQKRGRKAPLFLNDAFVLELLYKIWYNISRKSIRRKEISMKSVAMAFYNGAKYIDEQIRSILDNMEETDELIISVDDASDGSEAILEDWVQNDQRIRIIKGPGKGVVKNFENAFKHCRGEIIFLSDQDDVWKKNKMREIERVFEDPKVMAVVHDAQIVDEKLSSLDQTTFEWRNSGTGFWKNMKKNSYIGCCMAVRRSAMKRILPIPDDIWIHDQWIGLLSEQLGKVVFLEKPLIYYRRHGGNVTELTHGSITSMIKKDII